MNELLFVAKAVPFPIEVSLEKTDTSTGKNSESWSIHVQYELVSDVTQWTQVAGWGQEWDAVSFLIAHYTTGECVPCYSASAFNRGRLVAQYSTLTACSQ